MALTIIKLGTEKENFEPNMILQTRMTICKFLECECEKLWEWAITSNRSHIDPIMLEVLIQSLCFFEFELNLKLDAIRIFIIIPKMSLF
jgi:hypothetical protein